MMKLAPQPVIYRSSVSGLKVSSIDALAFLDGLPDAVATAHDSVSLSYAASGSSGITVADDADINFGTGDFTLVWRGSLPDWRPVVFSRLLNKYISDGYFMGLGADGVIGSYVGPYLIYSTIANTFTNGTIHQLTMVVVRETPVANGSCTFYADDVQFGAAIVINATATPLSVDNSTPVSVLGVSDIRYAGTTTHALTYNRALSAAEVLSLHTAMNDPTLSTAVAAADQWGSQTAVYTSDFSAGVDGWSGTVMTVTGNVDSIGGINDTLRGVVDSDGGYRNITKTVAFSKTRNIRLSYDVYIPSTNISAAGVYFTDSASGEIFSTATIKIPTADTWETYSIEGTPISTANGTGLNIFPCTSAGSVATQKASDIIYVKNIKIENIGCTLALEPTGIKTAGWLDSSTNDLDATYPAAGTTLDHKYFNGLDSLELYDSAGAFLKGCPSAIGTGETLDTEIATGTLTAGRLYKITATEADHFGTGLVVGGYFTSVGSETCDANNKVQQVLTASAAGTSIVSAKGGLTQNFKYKDTGFSFNQGSYGVVIRKLRGRHLNLSGTTTGIRFSAIDDTAFVDNLPAEVLPFADGKHYIKIFDSAGKAVEGVVKAVGSGETLDSEIHTDPGFDDDSKWIKDYGDWVVSGGVATSTSHGRYSAVSQTISVNLGTGKLYKTTFDINAISNYLDLLWCKAGLVFGPWSTTGTKTVYGTKVDSATAALRAYLSVDILDNWSIKQVLTPSASGVTIVNAISGTTYRFITKETGFNFNDTGTFSYQIWSE